MFTDFMNGFKQRVNTFSFEDKAPETANVELLHVIFTDSFSRAESNHT